MFCISSLKADRFAKPNNYSTFYLLDFKFKLPIWYVMKSVAILAFCSIFSVVIQLGNAVYESGPRRGVVSRLGEVLEQDTVLEDRLVEVLNQQEIKETLDSAGLYVGLIGTGLSAGLGTILGNAEQVLKSLQKK